MNKILRCRRNGLVQRVLATCTRNSRIEQGSVERPYSFGFDFNDLAENDMMNQLRAHGTTLMLLMAGTAFAISMGFTVRSNAATPTRTILASGTNKVDVTLFETVQVRPLAQSADGRRLYALNTPDGRLEVFDTQENGLSHVASIPVGLEPVSVAVRNDGEVWVVNQLSDSVSIVDVRPNVMRVVRTLNVGDEPRDVVFAGNHHDRAFVTAAHRGQNAPFDPQLTTPGVGRADVWVFDTEAVQGAQRDSLAGRPLAILNMFADTPRALAASPDGSRVYAAGYMTGNRTTVIPEEVVTANGGLPPPQFNFQGIAQPPTGMIVKFDGTHWRDSIGRTWDNFVKFSLPDKDVFVIDATAPVPRLVTGARGSYRGVGTVLNNMVVNPRNGNIYVSNLDANNLSRFEGAPAGGSTSIRGHLQESHITVLMTSGEVLPRHLNKHINYDICCKPAPNDESVRSLAFPMDMAVSSDGRTLYVAAFGSSKVGIFSTQDIEADTFKPDAGNHVALSGGGPSGVLLDESRHRLYVLTRFNNSVALVDTRLRREVGSVSMHNPEPASVVNGRRFLYDAALTSSHGDSACASCHVGGDLDGLAWDLGNPNSSQLNNPGPFTLLPSTVGSDETVHYRPLKGPMTTQSLRGLANHGPMHWRGDRTGGNDAAFAQPDSGTFDEVAAFKKFNPAFQDLLGRSAQLTDDQMQAMTDFVLQISYPPNPIRNLDNSLTPAQQAGHDFYFNQVSDKLFACNGCHILDPKGNLQFGVAKPGFFGTEGKSAFEFETQIFKIPHFRNLYQKVGMFGMAPTPKLLGDNPDGSTNFMGDQVRGFGFLHDGSNDTILRFLTSSLFRASAPGSQGPGDPGNPAGFPDGAIGTALRRNVEQFLLAYDSNLAPIVGQQVTLTRFNAASATPRIQLLLSRADAGECDVVATRRSSRRGYLYAGGAIFVRPNGHDRIAESVLRDKVLRDGVETTYLCAPLGSGARLADAAGRVPVSTDSSDD
jgi:YVTN family beta-propeller protein